MRRALRENAPCALLALAGCATLAWLGLYGFTWSDYEVETQPSLEALVHGHVARFLELAPVYGGSLIERAPFALLPGLWGGGALAVYRAVAVPCLLASAVIAVVLVAGMRAEGRPRLARGLVLGLLVANPISLLALEVGPPGGTAGRRALCLGAILLAAAGRGLAPARAARRPAAGARDREQAVGDRRRRPRSARAARIAAGHLRRRRNRRRGGDRGAAADRGRLHLRPREHHRGRARSGIFQPWQVWWFLGHHGALVHGLFGAAKPGYRIEPGWTSTVSHPLVIFFGVGVSRPCCGCGVVPSASPRRRRCRLRARDGAALRAGHLGHRLLHGPRPVRAHGLGGEHAGRCAARARPPRDGARLAELQLAAPAGSPPTPGGDLPRLVAAARRTAGLAPARRSCRLASRIKARRRESPASALRRRRARAPRSGDDGEALRQRRQHLAAVRRARRRGPRCARRAPRAGRRRARPSRRCRRISGCSGAVRDSRGASWISSPTPWPSP